MMGEFFGGFTPAMIEKAEFDSITSVRYSLNVGQETVTIRLFFMNRYDDKGTLTGIDHAVGQAGENRIPDTQAAADAIAGLLTYLNARKCLPGDHGAGYACENHALPMSAGMRIRQVMLDSGYWEEAEPGRLVMPKEQASRIMDTYGYGWE